MTVDIEVSPPGFDRRFPGLFLPPHRLLSPVPQKSPQSYVITPKGGNKPGLPKSAEDYGMDQNSDDSTDDESAPRKPIPSWAESKCRLGVKFKSGITMEQRNTCKCCFGAGLIWWLALIIIIMHFI